MPVTLPTNLTEWLVEGLFGKGYQFGGKGSGITYATGNDAGGSACDQMYWPMANFSGDSGTVSLYLVFRPAGEAFSMTNGAAIVTIPKRDFRMLLLEPRQQLKRQETQDMTRDDPVNVRFHIDLAKKQESGM
ncbi:MAG: hypothetical protein PHR35_20940 [Kiritimatiellae bacterium]|nr:hypothetical protein [Kiritimatiellia bacterium]